MILWTTMKGVCSNFRRKVVLLFFAVSVITKESKFGEFLVKTTSPRSSYVVRGEPLKLKVEIISTTEVGHSLIIIRWYFQPFFSTNSTLILATHNYRQRAHAKDKRFSTNQATLLLVNTTLNDTGRYFCQLSAMDFGNYTLNFNVTILEKPKAEITCSKNVNLNEKENFVCWCRAKGYHLVPTASWLRSGKVLVGETVSSNEQKLSLINVTKFDAGTYICRTQLYSVVSEELTEIIIYYAPRIHSFQSMTSGNKIRLLCLADGLPEPSYTIQASDGTELARKNTVVVIGNDSLVANATCIARNSLGQHRRIKTDDYPRFSGGTQNQKKSVCVNRGLDWYIVLISLLVGIFGGVGLLYGIQWIRRNKAMNIEQIDDTHEYVNCDVLPLQRRIPAVVYQNADQTFTREMPSHKYTDLTVDRPNEENPYQGLYVTPADDDLNWKGSVNE